MKKLVYALLVVALSLGMLVFAPSCKKKTNNGSLFRDGSMAHVISVLPGKIR